MFDMPTKKIDIYCCLVPDTPTCNATEKVAMNMSSFSLSCWTFDPCEEIRCLSTHGEDTLRVIMVKCNKPPAVRVVYTYANGRVWFDHTFTYSEAVTVYYSDFVFVWNVTLVQLENGIGFEVCKYIVSICIRPAGTVLYVIKAHG